MKLIIIGAYSTKTHFKYFEYSGSFQ